MKDLWQLKRQFLEYCEIEKGQSVLTIENYGRYLDRFLTWLQNENPKSKAQISNEVSNDKISNEAKEASQANKAAIYPEEITREIVRLYRLYVNRLYDKKGRELKSSTQNHHILALRAFLRYLSMQGVKVISPDEISLAKTGERKINYLTAEEYKRLLLAPKDNLRDRAILELLFSTGMRVSELVWLNVGDLNLERGEIAVLGKGKKVRVVFLSESAVMSLIQYLVKRGALSVNIKAQNPKSNRSSKSKIQNPSSEKLEAPKIVLGSTYQVSGDSENNIRNPESEIPNTLYMIHDSAKKQPLFLSGRNKRINVRGVERMVQKYAKSAGISRNVSPHTLRHTFATDLLIAGADIRSVQSLLGHSNISTTQVYTHVTDQHLREVHHRYHNRNHTDRNTDQSR